MSVNVQHLNVQVGKGYCTGGKGRSESEETIQDILF